MLSEIEQDIDHARADLAGRAQRARVVSIAPEVALPPQDPIHGQSNPDGEALHTPLQQGPPVGLDDQVNVVVLHGVVHHPKPGAARTRK
jgi:hypothetical protein